MYGDVTVVSDWCLWWRIACKLRENATRNTGYRNRVELDSSLNCAVMINLAVSTADALVARRKGGADATKGVFCCAKRFLAYFSRISSSPLRDGFRL